MTTKPNPGSDAAIALGCSCPVMDNSHGRGYLGGVKNKDGEVMFVITRGCLVHEPEENAPHG